MHSLHLHIMKSPNGDIHPATGFIMDKDGNHVGFVNGRIKCNFPTSTTPKKQRGRKKSDERRMAVYLAWRYFLYITEGKKNEADSLTAQLLGYAGEREVRRVRQSKRIQTIIEACDIKETFVYAFTNKDEEKEWLIAIHSGETNLETKEIDGDAVLKEQVYKLNNAWSLSHKEYSKAQYSKEGEIAFY